SLHDALPISLRSRAAELEGQNVGLEAAVAKAAERYEAAQGELAAARECIAAERARASQDEAEMTVLTDRLSESEGALRDRDTALKQLRQTERQLDDDLATARAERDTLSAAQAKQ